MVTRRPEFWWHQAPSPLTLGLRRGNLALVGLRGNHEPSKSLNFSQCVDRRVSWMGLINMVSRLCCSRPQDTELETDFLVRILEFVETRRTSLRFSVIRGEITICRRRNIRHQEGSTLLTDPAVFIRHPQAATRLPQLPIILC